MRTSRLLAGPNPFSFIHRFNTMYLAWYAIKTVPIITSF